MNNIIDIFYAITENRSGMHNYKAAMCNKVLALSSKIVDETKCGVSIHCSNCVFNNSKVDNIPKLRKQLKKID